MSWDEATRNQFWLLLRAADWRSWTFLDTTNLLARYLPEWSAIARRRSGDGARDFALDTHSFLALRRLHEWLDGGEPFARRLWSTLRHRDWVYLAVLLHETDRASAIAVAERCGLTDDAVVTVGALVEDYRVLAEVATLRDLHDEDLLFDVAARIGGQQRLRMLFLVAIAHALAAGGDAWSPWRAALLRRLFGLLDTTLRSSGEVGARRRRSVEQHRERLRRELARRHLDQLAPIVGRLPRRYLLSRSSAFIARHLALAAHVPLGDGEVRLRAERHRRAEEWDLLVIARDRPGLLATMSGVLALRGATVLAADAATSADGLVLDVFTVGSAYGAPLEASLWPALEADLHAALDGRLPLDDLLASVPAAADDSGQIGVEVDNAASQVFSVVEVHAPDRVGLLYRITRALYDLGLDIHHAKVATYPEGALDVFYVWDLLATSSIRSARARSARRSRGGCMVEFWLGTFPTLGRARDLAEMAEADGWDGLAFTDSQNLHGDTFAQLALAAHATRRLRLATGATNPATRHPAVVASAIATIQAESGGRAVLGIARGDSALAYVGRPPMPFAEFAAALEQIQTYLRGEAVASTDSRAASNGCANCPRCR